MTKFRYTKADLQAKERNIVNKVLNFNHGFDLMELRKNPRLHPEAVIYYYKDREGNIQGSESAYKVSKLIYRDWEEEVKPNSVARTTYNDFKLNLKGNLHNIDWW